SYLPLTAPKREFRCRVTAKSTSDMDISPIRCLGVCIFWFRDAVISRPYDQDPGTEEDSGKKNSPATSNLIAGLVGRAHRGAPLSEQQRGSVTGNTSSSCQLAGQQAPGDGVSCISS